MAKRMLVMAGGRGQRLHPLTLTQPKPLLRVGGKPILEHTLSRLRQFGITDVTIAVAYLAPMIQSYFETGTRLGLRIHYMHELVPLGTAGAIAQLDDLDDTTFVVNGDIISDINFTAMLRTHRASSASITVAAKRIVTNLEFGVLDTDERGRIVGYRGEPRIEHRFGLGMYIVEPSIIAFMQQGEHIDMPELIMKLIRAGRTVAAYEHSGNWIDIGRPDDYARAKSEIRGIILRDGTDAAAADQVVNV